MGRKVRAVLFWAIMSLALIGLFRSNWGDWRDTLRTGAYVVPVALFTFWFESRFPAQKRWTANLVIGSVLLALVSGLIVVSYLISRRAGFEARGGPVAAVVAGAVCITSVSAFVWSLIRLARRDDKIPT
jgi:hypothetical protein